MAVRFFVSPKTCEHCDDHHSERGWWGWSDAREPCALSAKSGSGPWAPYGWCCRGCEPAMRAMFGRRSRNQLEAVEAPESH